MRNNLKITILFLSVLMLVWLFFFRDYSGRISENAESLIFTTKIEKIVEIDCDQVFEVAEEPFCLEVFFRDPSDGVEVSTEVNGVATFSNFASTLSQGDLIRVSRVDNFGEEVGGDTEELQPIYIINGFDRLNSYYFMLSIFILVVVLFTGVKGVKSLLSLLVSLLIIVYVIVPLTVNGFNPVLIASLIGFIMFSILIVITNGWNKHSLFSIGGASVGILSTILFTLIFSSISNLSGMGEEETSMLASVLDVDIDIVGVIMASLILGVLGVVDDASVSQVHTVGELIRSNPDTDRHEIYKSAMRVGASHIGSLINTLFLAYVASSFALFILISLREQNLIDLLSSDLIAEEIVRTVVGSLGLVITIPASTLLASRFFKLKDLRENSTGHSH